MFNELLLGYVRSSLTDIFYVSFGNLVPPLVALPCRIARQVADTLRAEVALDALEMAIWSRGGRIRRNLVHHSDRGVQYAPIRYAEWLGEISAVRSV